MTWKVGYTILKGKKNYRSITMQYILKVSPKGQVTLPKKLREGLGVKDFIEIKVKDYEGILKKPEKSTEELAGCFKKYTLRKRIPLEKAVEKAIKMTAREIAQKNN
ncbi:MAG: AbrB/MazE/SpoVT family DNA-binding domain-containing protein [Nitrospirota bacterium]